MTRQLNVRQQNALTTKDILSAATLFERADRRVSWLDAALRARNESGDWAAAGSVDTNLSFSSRFKLCRADVAQRRVSPSRVVEALDVVEHV